jgi:hypothetical protein
MRALRLLPVLVLLASAQEAEDPFVHLGQVGFKHATEISGLVKSPTYPDTYWVHNDSGDEARLIALDGKGEVILPPWAGLPDQWPGHRLRVAANYDWEDITAGDGNLYVADMGNNGNARRDLGVYVVCEPNPRAIEWMRPLKWIPIRYPDQKEFPAREWHFDCEAVFFADGKLYFLTKHRADRQINRGERGTKLYRLDTQHTDRVNVLTLVEKNAELAMPTAADVSPDGKKLAVLTVLALWVFEKPESGDKWLSGKARKALLPRARTKQAEAVCWDDDETLRLANEQRDLFRVKLAALK